MCSLFVMGILNMSVLFVTMFFVTTIGIELPAIHLLRNIHFFGGENEILISHYVY